MSDDEIHKLADLLSENMTRKHKENGCIFGMDQDTVENLKEFVALYKSGKSSARMAFWGAALMGFVGLVILGVVEYVKKTMGVQ